MNYLFQNKVKTITIIRKTRSTVLKCKLLPYSAQTLHHSEIQRRCINPITIGFLCRLFFHKN